MSEPQAPPLRLLRLDELNMGPEHTIVRPRSPGLVGTSLLCLVFAGFIGRDAWRGGLHWSIAGVLILALCGMAWMGYRASRRFKRAGAWLLAVGPDHVLIRFRSVVSQHLPADLPQVIELPLANVLWVRAMERKLEQGGGRSETRSRYEYLDFRIAGADLRPLQAELMEDQRERSRRWFALRDPSVAVTWDGVLRVEMSLDGASAVPGTRAVLDLLAARVPVEADGWEHVDVRPVATLSPAEQDAAIRAVGETSVNQALTLASGFFSDAPESAAAYVQHLLACPGPAELESRAARSVLAAAADPTMPAARLLSPADARPGRTDTVVRPRSPRTLVWALLFLASSGWVGWKGYTGGMHWGWATLLGGVLGLLGAASLYFWLMTLRPGGWRMAVGDTRMLVRFRDYAKRRPGPDHPQVVELPYAHVASVRQTAQTVASPVASGGSTSARSYTFLDIRTHGLDLSALRDALARERAMDPGAARYGPAPAALLNDGVLRVLMVSRDEFTRPGIAEVVRLLGAHVPVEEEATEAVDATGAPALPPARHEGAVRDLAQAGQTWDAVQLARSLYGDTLGQANERVRQLAGSPAEAGQTV